MEEESLLCCLHPLDLTTVALPGVVRLPETLGSDLTEEAAVLETSEEYCFLHETEWSGVLIVLALIIGPNSA